MVLKGCYDSLQKISEQLLKFRALFIKRTVLLEIMVRITGTMVTGDQGPKTSHISTMINTTVYPATAHGSSAGLGGYSSLTTSATNLVTPHGSFPIIGIVILSFSFIIGFPGNAFVIWTILHCMKKCSVTCLLILHLAIADIIVILTAPMFLHLLSSGSWVFGNIVCKLCHYISCLSMYASIILITSMSIDRFIGVAKPLLSVTIRTRNVFGKIVLAIWVAACLLAIPMPIYRAVEIINSQPQCRHIHNSPRHVIFQYTFETITGFVIPFSIILFCYLYIRVRLQSAKFQTKHKTSRLVIMIIVIFALFWLPYHIVNIMQVSGEASSSERLIRLAQSARPSVTALAFLSSSINPILYAFAGGSFIGTAGVEFMAKLFEAAGSDSNVIRKLSHAVRQNQEETIDFGDNIR
ncbi:leukotriene B4 receptor 1-like [Gastrophryne carolinensis]